MSSVQLSSGKLAALAFAGISLLSSASLQAAEALKQLGQPEGALDIIAWPGYIERGESDKNYDWVTQFEKDTGCKVNVKTAATSDEMVSLMAKGGYDLVTASGDASLRLVYGKRVQPINIALVPNWKNVDPRLQNAPWHTVDGTHYGTPYQWGPNVLMYNTKVFPKAPLSWSVVFSEQKLPDGKSNKGRVQAYDGPIYIADAALYLKTTNPALGIQDPYELNEEQYAATLKLLRDQQKLIHRYWHDATVQMSDFKNEGVAASGSWPYQVNALVGEKQPIESTIPVEGVTGWADTTMMHVDAKHPTCAYKWLNWSLEPKVQGDVAAWFGSVPASPAGCTGSQLLGPQGCATNGYDQFDRIAFWKTPQAKCAQGQCVPYSRWTQDYIAIMGGR
ncbi:MULTISPECIES: putative ABC transporter substrate-binding protein YdcS [Pseudomonas]|uniref:putative ABC transporter substrate-binding protein YdcS n=1 Tax=Pseudomonas TaxID=286 RepID=UPI0023D823E8|nr:putative ABC transporter substrate-binding protein YdcS [Pseudomonas sp. PSE14]WEJ70433.1 ABC transporter substrate-binding protein [Pseudomonas sp. PSE14]